MPLISTFLGLKPKPLHDGPRYGNSNDRSMASALDIVILFFLLNRISSHISEKIYALYNQIPPGSQTTITSFEQLADTIWQVRYPWLLSNSLIIAMMGVVLVAFQIAYGTTPGKWLLGLKIVRVNTLEPIHGWRYGLRFLGYIPAALPLMLGIFWMSFNNQRRGWHDYIAGTVVIYTRPQGWLWQQIKHGFFWLRGKIIPSRAVKKTMGQPPAE